MMKKMVTCPSTLLTSLTLKPRIRAGNLLPCLPHQSYTIQVGPGALPCFMALTVVLFCSCIVGILIFLMFVVFFNTTFCLHFLQTLITQFLESLNTTIWSWHSRQRFYIICNVARYSELNRLSIMLITDYTLFTKKHYKLLTIYNYLCIQFRTKMLFYFSVKSSFSLFWDCLLFLRTLIFI